jgi:hypothetical protein
MLALGPYIADLLKIWPKAGGMPKVWKEFVFFRESHAIMRVDVRIRLEEQKLSGIIPGQRAQNHFLTTVDRAAA